VGGRGVGARGGGLYEGGELGVRYVRVVETDEGWLGRGIRRQGGEVGGMMPGGSVQVWRKVVADRG